MRKLLLLAALGLAACGSSSSSSTSGSSGTTGGSGSSGTSGTTGSQAVTFTIGSGMTWPAGVNVPANGTLHVVNNDSAPHTVTSQASAGAFTPGAPSGVTAFDSGTIPAGGTADIAIKGSAGATVPVYCKFHTRTMSPPSPVITLQ